MATVLVDGKEIVLPDGQKLNGIQVARLAGTDIPHYCWHPGLTVVASCRMCLCETGTRDPATGKVTMLPKLVPACQTPATDNTVFVTDSEKIRNARAMVEEDLLIDHPIDCPICDKAGECLLQDYHFEHGRDQRRADIRPFTSRRREMGDTVTLFVDRCVMCTRCVRFTREISGDAELMVINRGAHEEIDVFPGYPLDNKLSGNVVDLCPVGALGDKDFLYQQRVWFMKKHAGVCAGCSTGCSITIEENQDRVYRLKPRENPEINQWWMCDEGRYGYHHVHAEGRQTEPRRIVAGERVNVEWSAIPRELNKQLREAGRIAVAISPHLTVEEAYLLAAYARSIDADALLALGPVPVIGEDEKFKNGFTIHAEKCPNRRGVEEVLKHFTGGVMSFGDFANEVASGQVGSMWLSGGNKKSDWIDAATTEKLTAAKVIVVQDLFTSPAWEAATWQLPGAAFAEREGSYVNHANHVQSFTWAVRPPVGVWTEGQLLWRLLNRPGLYKARPVMQEIATTIDYFAAAAEEVPPTGVKLIAKKQIPASV
ncbi:MAG: ferredoxin [Planctomycetota bacterium]|nr:MAG: ferredoxin [Planctomycetota bacterium]